MFYKNSDGKRVGIKDLILQEFNAWIRRAKTSSAVIDADISVLVKDAALEWHILKYINPDQYRLIIKTAEDTFDTPPNVTAEEYAVTLNHFNTLTNKHIIQTIQQFAHNIITKYAPDIITQYPPRDKKPHTNTNTNTHKLLPNRFHKPTHTNLS